MIRTVKAQKDVFEKSLKPLVTILFIKLGKFNKFFKQVSIKLSTGEIDNSLETCLLHLSTELYNFGDHFDFSYEFDSFTQLNSEKFITHLSIPIHFKFADDDYEVANDVGTMIKIRKSYYDQLTDLEIKTITDEMADFVYTRLEKEIQHN